MAKLDVLLAEYPGDDAWAAFAAIFRPDLGGTERHALRALSPHDGDISETVAGIFGQEATAEWLEQPIPALDGQSPVGVIASRPDGYKIVRHALMRMPV